MMHSELSSILICLLCMCISCLADVGRHHGHHQHQQHGHHGHHQHHDVDHADMSHMWCDDASSSCSRSTNRLALNKPNVILMVADDMGVGDLTSYGHPTQEPGFIDEMAAKGLRFTNGYVGDSVCTPSRSAIMTGRLPIRIGTYGETRVFLPWTTTGLPKSEITIAEAMKAAGYATGMVGKWHLGINEKTPSDGAHLPYHHGFDYVGHNLPFTNSWSCDDTGLHEDFPSPDKCYLYRNATILNQPYQHRGLTQLFTSDAVEFIDEKKEEPFFLYVAFAHMHTSLFSHPDFSCKSRRGRYGDNLLEMHAGVKNITDSLERNNIMDNTVIFFISDHGPHREYCDEGGDANIFRGGKSLSWEGGHRVPYIVYWPGTVQPGISNELVTSMDIIKTAADLGGAPDDTFPADRVVDGKSIKDLILDPTSNTSPHTEGFFYYCKNILMAARHGQYKAHYRTQRVHEQSVYGEQCDGGFPIEDYFDCNECEGDCVTFHDPPLLFDLFQDPGEAYPLNVADYADVLANIQDAVSVHNSTMVPGKSLLDEFDLSIVPCCDPATNCICNYTQDPEIPVCYQYLIEVANRHKSPTTPAPIPPV
ncbi:LOW QUALITY PROTEIN: arylsulfatase [Strongylocentrotus purpuratus]|uniref:Arylsulfatase n=1 Tax=Strongylocentrotus purpuratus TaxID=7668 RepID=A0A7M7R912_STRPU|nr:LOW QUALITY PROTEIN: arylsulfatase [Strongylocentrotus purpuratus]